VFPLLGSWLAAPLRRGSFRGTPLLGDALYRDDLLVVNLRGQEILQDSEVMFYMQPPCVHFVRVATTGNGGQPFRELVLVGDDAKHPCIPPLKAHFPDARELFPSESLPNGLVATQATFLALLSAKHLAASTGSTFGIGAALLNPYHGEVNIHYPVFRGPEPLCCEMGFSKARLEQLCRLGPGSVVYEYPLPANAWKGLRLRRFIVETDESWLDNLTLHRCASG